MLTYRTGAAGSPSAGTAMADHLLEQTLPADKAALAQYYQRGVAPDPNQLPHQHTLAEPRRDMHPRLAALLGVDPHRAPNRDEIANLLNGQRADGTDIPGKQAQRATAALDAALGLDPERLPMAEEVDRILAGQRVDGRPVEGAATARRRFLNLLGIVDGEPDPQQVANLCAGRMADGSAIELAAYVRGVTASKTRIGYIDLCFSADKSLSVAWAFAPTEAERAMLAQAHRDAVDSALQFIARELGQVRKGKAGRDGSEPGHLGWISFDHYASRPTVEIARTDAEGRLYTELLTLKTAGDPQIHTHVAVPNVVLTDGGRIGAMDLDALQGRVHEFGAYYQAHVATNLRRLGVSVVLDERTGAARLTAVPSTVRDAFSKRTRDGTEAAREFAAGLGLDWDALSPARKSALLKEGTQKHKLAKTAGMSQADREAFERAARKDDVGDFAAWQRQARALGWAHRSVVYLKKPAAVLNRDERLERAYQAALSLLDAELQRRAKLDGQELRVIAARGLVASGVDGPADIDAITRGFRERGVRQDGRATALIWGEDVKLRGKARISVTTTLHETQERELVSLAQEAAADRSGALSVAAIAQAVRRREALAIEDGGLRFDGEHGAAQRAAMDTLGASGRLGVVIGVAGAGKSALLAPLVDAWREAGRQVYGAALAWRQADDLEKAGIGREDRAALSVFLKQAERGDLVLDARSVVVVDEIGLVGTRQMLELLRLQAKSGCQLVAVGDPKQAQAIEAGPVIDIMREALGPKAVPEILTTLRQQTERERATSLLFREGRAAEALAIKREDDTAKLVPGGYRDAVQTVAMLWKERMLANSADPAFSLTISAPTNADARAISTAIREQRRGLGLLGPDLARIDAVDQGRATYELALAAGDRVRLFDRATASFSTGTHGNIGNNGSVLEVLAVGKDGVTLRNSSGRHGLVRWGTLRDQVSGRIRLAYGDVLSIDATQGATSTEHINAMPAGSRSVNAFKGYVAESRHCLATWLVTSDGAERQEVAARRPLGDPRPISEADVWANMARNLSQQPEKASALAFLAEAKNLHRGAARGLQRGLRPGEQRRAKLQNGSTPDSFETRTRHARDAARSETIHQAGLRQSAVRLTKSLAIAVPGVKRLRAVLETAQRTAHQLRTRLSGQQDQQRRGRRHP